MTLTLPTRVRDFWDEIAPRERAMISIGLLILLPLGLYLYLWQPMYSERTRLAQRVEQQREQLVQLRADSEEIKRLRSQAPIRSGQTLEASARLAAARFGLADSISNLTAQGGDRISIEMEAAGFDAWLRWVGELGIQGVSLATCKVEALPTPGLVRVKATLTRTSS